MLVAHVRLISYPHTGMQSPSLDLVQRERVSGVLAGHMITKSPIAIIILQPMAYEVLNATKQQEKYIYALRNVRVGYVLYRALVE